MITVWYSHKYKCQFVGIPKTGSSTVRASLEITDKCNYKIDISEKLRYNYPCFTVIRHPYPRLVSAYHELQRMKIPRALVPFEQFIKQIDMFGYFNEHIFPQEWYMHPQIDKIYTLENGLLDFMLDHNLPELKLANLTHSNNVTLTSTHKNKIKLLYGQDLRLYEKKSVLY